jgi:ActR/RegA family two-component response regulator
MPQEEKRPCLIVAHGDAAYAAQVGHTFRRLGWDVHQSSSGPEVRRLARRVGPRLIVLDALLPNESGWLTCDKLRLEMPQVRVILAAVDPGFHEANFAVFVGAAGLVDRADGVPALVDEIEAVVV